MTRVFIIVSSVWATLIFRSMNARNLLWSNAVISAAAAACVLGSLALGGNGLTGPSEWAFAFGVGSATWWAYTWQRHVKSTRPDGLRPDHLAWHRHHWPSIRLVALLLLLFCFSSPIGAVCLVALLLLLFLLLLCLSSPIREVCLCAVRLLLFLLLFRLCFPIGGVCLFALRIFPSSCEDDPASAGAPSFSRHARDGWESVHDRHMAC